MPRANAENVRRWREKNLELNRERNRLHGVAYRQKIKTKMVKGTRYCRICQKEEQKEKFHEIFDADQRIALEIYLLSSVIVS